MKKKDKYTAEEDEFFIDEPKKSLANLIRQDFELFDDDSYIPGQIVSVKRVALPNNGENWEIFQDNKCAVILKGVRFTKKERLYLRSVDGVRFMMFGFKSGWSTVSEFKRQVSKWMKKK